MALNLQHQTAAELAAKIRTRFRDSSREEAARIAYWLIERINAGDITDAQCESAFGVSPAQWANFKTNKLVPMHDAWAAIRAAAGE